MNCAWFLFLFLSCIQDPPDWTEILTYFRGSELQNYFTKILEDDLKAIIKPQYVDQIPKAVKVQFLQLYITLNCIMLYQKILMLDESIGQSG